MHKNGAVCKVLTELYVNSEFTHEVYTYLSSLHLIVYSVNSTVQCRVIIPLSKRESQLDCTGYSLHFTVRFTAIGNGLVWFLLHTLLPFSPIIIHCEICTMFTAQASLPTFFFEYQKKYVRRCYNNCLKKNS